MSNRGIISVTKEPITDEHRLVFWLNGFTIETICPDSVTEVLEVKEFDSSGYFVVSTNVFDEDFLDLDNLINAFPEDTLDFKKSFESVERFDAVKEFNPPAFKQPIVLPTEQTISKADFIIAAGIAYFVDGEYFRVIDVNNANYIAEFYINQDKKICFYKSTFTGQRKYELLYCTELNKNKILEVYTNKVKAGTDIKFYR